MLMKCWFIIIIIFVLVWLNPAKAWVVFGPWREELLRLAGFIVPQLQVSCDGLCLANPAATHFLKNKYTTENVYNKAVKQA